MAAGERKAKNLHSTGTEMEARECMDRDVTVWLLSLILQNQLS